eukprot:COSAG01_NODE_28393_length_662_cov_0.884547_1_plen_30_part_10
MVNSCSFRTAGPVLPGKQNVETCAQRYSLD